MPDDTGQTALSPRTRRRPRRLFPADPDEVRMSLGDHLEELRRHVLRAVIGVLVAVTIALIGAKKLLAVIIQPARLILEMHNLPSFLQVLSPQEPFMIWVKTGIYGGLILAAPWVIWQIWLFVAAGLYPHERRFVHRLLPASAALFAAGALFFYFVVLGIMLNFFILFAQGMTFGPPHQSWIAAAIDHTPPPAPATQPTNAPVSVPIVNQPPPSPADGQIWYDATARRLCLRYDGRTWGLAMVPLDREAAIHPQFRLSEYVSFVGVLTLCFGLAFQLPLVVLFVVWLGIWTAGELARARRYVIFGIVVAAAVITPTPDVITCLLLAGPMYLLFEVGLLVGRLVERRRARPAPPAGTGT